MSSSIYADLERLIREDDRSINSLYGSWWSGVPPTSGAHSDVASTSYHPAEEWTTLSNDGGGSLTIARDGEVAVVSPGEWLAIGEERVLVRRRRRWAEGGFLWTASRRCAPLTAKRWRVRVYLPGGRFMPSREFKVLAGALDQAGYWFEGKVRLGDTRRHSDQCVFWLAAGDVVNAYAHLAVKLRSDPERNEPPPFTLRLGPVGVAHDPEGGESLGLLVCGAVVSARDLDAGLDLQTRWSLACEPYALCPDYPWRHPGAIDPFGVWSRLEQLPC